MGDTDEIQDLIDEVNIMNYNLKNYAEMKIEELSAELREIMKFQQESFERIEKLESKVKPDLIKYAKMICRNTTDREILKIQEIYLRKIDIEYLNKS